MQSYTVHEEPFPVADRLDRAERLVFIKDGFTWSAFLFAAIWLIVYRLWWALAAYVVLALALQAGGVALGVNQHWIAMAALTLNLLCGFEAHTLRSWGLRRRGWRMVGAITGRNWADCERRFFETWLPSQPILASSATTMPAGGARGWPGFGTLLGSRS